jgi:tRNA A-37 threonylcarbamoyl transferase component Bud32/tetratricopeptide (TPR) repeat protein
MPVTDVFFRQIQGALAGRYQVERQIGRGATATVYLARDLKHDRAVAVKVLRPELSAALGGDRFLREIKVAAGLQHPHILPLYDSGDAGGTLYYVMPFVEGESLRDRLNREPQLPLDDALRIAREVADALAYAHDADIVHRDIKPENILLSDGHAVVADFGIARAISRAGGEGLTETGMAIGTPVYMSPEQASGEPHVDGRTDIYSLGCVLYEMVAGKPPFTGPTTFAVIAHRLSDPPARLSTLRPDVTPQVEAAVERSLADDPANRYRTASELEIALGGYVYPRRAHRRPSRWLTIALVSAAAAVAVLAVVLRPGPAPLDDSLYVVLPFEHRMGAAPTLLNGNQCEILLHDALARWNDIRLVPEVRVNDARARLASTSLSLDGALRIARELGAANLAWGEISQVRDSVLVRAYLYDVRDPKRPPREQTVRLGKDLAGASEKFDSLADQLLLGTAKSRNSLRSAINTRSLAAWRHYDAGHDALRRWSLDSAAQSFRAAIELDASYADAHLWLAQTQAWRGLDSLRAVSTSASRAVALGSMLSPVDHGHASALSALAELRFPLACERYSHLVVTDSLNSAAWFGLGECHARDNIVVGAPNTLRFRGSFAVAMRAYTHALEMTPSANLAFRGPAMERLARLFYADYTTYRPGRLENGDARFAAWPQLVNDTVTFVPEPFEDVMNGRSRVSSSARAAGIARTRDALLHLTEVWVQTFPGSADAHAGLALVLEMRGQLRSAQAGGRSALTEVARARSLATDFTRRFDLAVDETRIRLKIGDFASARRLADSLLVAERPVPANAWRLAALAALTGHPVRSASLLKIAAPTYNAVGYDGAPVSAQLRVSETALELLAYASFGAPSDSLRALVQRLETQVRTWVPPAQRKTAREGLLETPLYLAFPELGFVSTGAEARHNYLREMQLMLVRGDTTGLRRQIAQIASLRKDQRPGDVTFDALYHESVLLLALGDTSIASQRLGDALDALEAQTFRLLQQPPQSATLVRSMILRAALAEREGNRAEAARWASAVVDLWGDADPVLQPFVADMRRIAGR